MAILDRILHHQSLARQKYSWYLIRRNVIVLCASVITTVLLYSFLSELIDLSQIHIQRIYSNDSHSSIGNVAYATFYAPRGQDLDEPDEYFNATRLLAYKLLYDPETRTKINAPLVVMVTPYVAQWKRQILENDGCRVVEVQAVEGDYAITPAEERWIDTFSKLRIWQFVEYDRILFMDTDMLVQRCMDEIWNELASVPVHSDERIPDPYDEEPADGTYLLASIGDACCYGHSLPRPLVNNFNSGFFMLKPSQSMFNKFLSVLNKPEKFSNDWVEQGLLNYVYRLDGRTPWQRLEGWSVKWPSYNDYLGGVATLHDRFWIPDAYSDGPDPMLVEMWNNDMQKMIAFSRRGGSKMIMKLALIMALALIVKLTPVRKSTLIITRLIPTSLNVSQRVR